MRKDLHKVIVKRKVLDLECPLSFCAIKQKCLKKKQKATKLLHKTLEKS